MYDPLRLGGKSHTNYDFCHHFAEAYKGKAVPVGARFSLPDIGQVYTVEKVTFFGKKGGKPKPLLVLEAECALDDCNQSFQTTAEPRSMWNRTGMVRTCKDHRGSGWRSPCKMAWMPGVARDHALGLVEQRKVEKEEARPAKAEGPRAVGSVQAEVLSVLDMVDVLGLDEEGVVRAVAARLPRGVALADQRIPVARRALASLRARGLAGQLA